MRVTVILTAMLAGCAGQPSNPVVAPGAASPPVAVASPASSPATASVTAPASAPVSAYPSAQAPAALAAAATAGAAPGVAVTPDIESQRLAAARNLNLKVVNKDGKELYCRSNYLTGSHIQRDVQCFTADQLQRMQEQTQRDLDQINMRPNGLKGLP
jgi:hypothetical protein